MVPGLILQHEESGPPALFAEWCERRGIAYEILRVWEDGLPDAPDGLPWLCALGSEHSPAEQDAPAWVAAEIAFLRAALDAGVPVLGLCFGGQALAAAAGAQVRPADPPEVGWQEIETSDPDRIPAGPWLHFHYDQLDVPPGAEELARSSAGPAAFALGPSLGLQFHPEVTLEIMDDWVRTYRHELDADGVDPDELMDETRRRIGPSNEMATRLLERYLRDVAKLRGDGEERRAG